MNCWANYSWLRLRLCPDLIDKLSVVKYFVATLFGESVLILIATTTRAYVTLLPSLHCRFFASALSNSKILLVLWLRSVVWWARNRWLVSFRWENGVALRSMCSRVSTHIHIFDSLCFIAVDRPHQSSNSRALWRLVWNLTVSLLLPGHETDMASQILPLQPFLAALLATLSQHSVGLCECLSLRVRKSCIFKANWV